MTVTREYGIVGPELGLFLKPTRLFRGLSRGCSQSGQQMAQLPTLGLPGRGHSLAGMGCFKVLDEVITFP